MPELTSDATALVDAVAAHAVDAVKRAYLLGAQQGTTAFRQLEGAGTLEEWRNGMLQRYRGPSWKRSIVQLVPKTRFRPPEVYRTQRERLAALHPNNKRMSVATHNALLAMQRDGSIVKLGNVYAAAIDGVALPADDEDPTANYRPRHLVDGQFARLLGFAVLAWTALEREVAGVVAIDGCPDPSLEPDVRALQYEFRRLSERRAALNSAQPGTVIRGSLIAWNNQQLMDTCRAFDIAATVAKDLAQRMLERQASVSPVRRLLQGNA